MKKIISLLLVSALGLTVEVANADFTFGEPINLGPLINSSGHDLLTSISTDELELYITSNRSGGHGDWDIWVARRATKEAEWSTPVNLGSTINTLQRESLASISGDGLELYFNSYNRTGGYGQADIWVTRRPTKNFEWGTPVNLGPSVNSYSMEAGPWISIDGLELYFGSNRAEGYGNMDIWLTKRPSKEEPWEPAVNIGSVVNSFASEFAPFISADGLSLFFCEDLPGPFRPGGFGFIDVWVTRRASISDPWTIPVNLGPAINTAFDDGDPSLSGDGRFLYFASNRPGGYGDSDAWRAPIIPIVDFSGDRKVDLVDFCRLAQYWLQNEWSVDIDPPIGNGIVDIQDMAVLAEHWLEEF